MDIFTTPKLGPHDSCKFILDEIDLFDHDINTETSDTEHSITDQCELSSSSSNSLHDLSFTYLDTETTDIAGYKSPIVVSTIKSPRSKPKKISNKSICTRKQKKTKKNKVFA
eukprot:886041_1